MNEYRILKEAKWRDPDVVTDTTPPYIFALTNKYTNEVWVIKRNYTIIHFNLSLIFPILKETKNNCNQVMCIYLVANLKEPNFLHSTSAKYIPVETLIENMSSYINMKGITNFYEEFIGLSVHDKYKLLEEPVSFLEKVNYYFKKIKTYIANIIKK